MNVRKVQSSFQPVGLHPSGQLASQAHWRATGYILTLFLSTLLCVSRLHILFFVYTCLYFIKFHLTYELHPLNVFLYF